MTDRLSFIDTYNTKMPNTLNNTITNDDSKGENDASNNILDPKLVGTLFTRKMRYFIFILLVITNLIINMDHGTIPAATSEIKNDLNINDDILGIFGSLVYLGNLLGSMIFFSIIGFINRKWIIILSLVLIILCLYSFAQITDIYFLFFNRVLTGVMQVILLFIKSFIIIYFPVWCDQYSPNGKRSMMIALLQMGVPLGVVFGYVLTVIIKNTYSWHYSLYVQGVGILILCFIFIFLPSVYFSGKLHNERKTSLVSNDGLIEETTSVYKESETNMKPFNIYDNLRILCGNYFFLFNVLGISILFFIITAVQFWVTDYLKNVLKIDERTVSISFMTTCITAPTFGIILGGYLATKLKSNDSMLSLSSCVVLAVFALTFSIPIPFIQDIYSFSVLLWLILFCGAAIMPILTGIIISSVPYNLRANGNSLSNFFANLIGYLPAPFIYGIISKNYKEKYPKLALSVTLFSSSIGIIFLLLSCYFKSKYYKEKELLKDDQNQELKKKTSEISKHASLLATYWGNKQIENQFAEVESIPEEKRRTNSVNEGNKYKFVYKDGSRENSMIIPPNENNEKQEVFDFDRIDLKNSSSNNTIVDPDLIKFSYNSFKSHCNKSI